MESVTHKNLLLNNLQKQQHQHKQQQIRSRLNDESAFLFCVDGDVLVLYKHNPEGIKYCMFNHFY